MFELTSSGNSTHPAYHRRSLSRQCVLLISREPLVPDNKLGGSRTTKGLNNPFPRFTELQVSSCGIDVRMRGHLEVRWGVRNATGVEWRRVIAKISEGKKGGNENRMHMV